jgi:hypothetical protein
MKLNQAIIHIDIASNVLGGGQVDEQHVKIDEKTLPDGKTKMTFLAKKPNELGKTLEEVMNEVLELTSESLIRKLTK